MKDDDSKMAASAICFAADMVKAAWQEAAAILAALAEERDAAEAEAAALREALRDEIVMAYEQGALDVHLNWQEDRDPDFSEAASDYAASRAALKENYDGL